MVGLVVGEVALQQVQFGVQGVGQAEPLDQQSADAQAAEAPAPHLLGVVIMDVLVPEQPPLMLPPLPLAQAALQTALAVPHLLVYLGLHLKLLAHQGNKAFGLTSLFSGSAEEFQAYAPSSENNIK